MLLQLLKNTSKCFRSIDSSFSLAIAARLLSESLHQRRSIVIKAHATCECTSQSVAASQGSEHRFPAQPHSNPSAGSTGAPELPAHHLQGLTDQYLNDPHNAAARSSPTPSQTPDDETWCPGDPPPLEATLPPLQGDTHMHLSQEVQDAVSPYEYARLNHVEPLAAWVCTNGGYINTSLDIGTSPTLGCRGVIAKERLGVLNDTEAVIIVPQSLVIDTQVAKAGLCTVLSSNSIDKMSPNSLLALFLAMERRRGDASFWAPYISSLPHNIPCAWAMKPNVAAAALKAHGAQIGKGLFKTNAKKAVDLTRKLHTQYGASLKLSLADVQWGYGMVQSRCYKSVVPREDGPQEEEPAMLPYLDICNHSDEGQSIGWGRPSASGQQMCACIVQSAEQPIAEDVREIFINYFTNISDPGYKFLVYGFV